MAYAVSCWKFWYFCWTTTVAVWVSPLTLPETTLTAPNSPSERARLSTTPYTTAHLMLGRVIRRNVCHALAPEAARGLLLVVADLVEHRHHLADDQRQRHEARSP